MSGRVVLLKSVLLSLLIYFLSLFMALKGIIHLLESLFKCFFMGRGREYTQNTLGGLAKGLHRDGRGGWG